MARQTREEWLSTLKPGDAISVKFPGDELPSVGKAETVEGSTVVGSFPGRPGLEVFEGGAIRGYPEAKLWMVSTGSGGSVGPAGLTSNVMAAVVARIADGR